MRPKTNSTEGHRFGGFYGHGLHGHGNSIGGHWAAKPNGKLVRRGGTGSAIVANKCPFVVQTNIVHAPRAGREGAPEEIPLTLQPGESQSHPFEHDLNMGVSWKVWRTDTANKNVVQFEYTCDGQRTYYDMSMINGGTVEYLEGSEHEGEAVKEGANNDGSGKLTGDVGVVHPFREEGLSLKAQGSVGGGCGAVVCLAGEKTCAQAYNTDDDHQAMRDCGASVDLRLTLCG